MQGHLDVVGGAYNDYIMLRGVIPMTEILRETKLQNQMETGFIYLGVVQRSVGGYMMSNIVLRSIRDSPHHDYTRNPGP